MGCRHGFPPPHRSVPRPYSRSGGQCQHCASCTPQELSSPSQYLAQIEEPSQNGNLNKHEIETINKFESLNLLVPIFNKLQLLPTEQWIPSVFHGIVF